MERVLGDVLRDVLGDVLEMGCFLHRFLILGGKLGNRCKVLPVYTLLRAVILDLRGSI